MLDSALGSSSQKSSLTLSVVVVARLLFDPSPFPKLRPKDEECCGGSNQLVVGVLWHFATSIGTFVAGRLGFAGSLGIDALVGNGNGWRPNMEGRSQRGQC